MRNRIYLLMIVFHLVTPNLWADNDKKVIKETFYMNSSFDTVAVTGDPANFVQRYPSNLSVFSEPRIAGGLVIVGKVHDVSGETIGFATEMEHLTSDLTGVFSKSDWTIKVPGRGALFATEIEDFKDILAELMDMVANGEMERYINPPLVTVTTSPTTGKIVGGTGEFEGATGSFQEINEVYYLNLSGIIGVNVTLDLSIDMKDKD